MSIYNILQSNKITRKKLRSKYYHEKKEGQEKEDLEVFYNKLKNLVIIKQFFRQNFYLSQYETILWKK